MRRMLLHSDGGTGVIERLVCMGLMTMLGIGYATAMQVQAGTGAVGGVAVVDLGGLPEGAYAPLETLNVKDADLRDVFRGIAHQYGLNLIVDNRVERRVTIRLAGLPVVEAVAFLCRENGLVLARMGQVLRVELPPAPPPPAPIPPRVSVVDGHLTADLKGEELDVVARLLAEQSGRSIVVRQGVRGPLHGLVQNVPFDAGLRMLLQTNGFALREQDGMYVVDRAGFEAAGEGSARAFWVQVADSVVSFDVVGARIADVLREIGAQLDVNLVTYQEPEGQITAKVRGLTLEAALGYLLRSTNVTYRREGDVYFIGGKQANGIAATRLVRLDHIRADAVLALIPESLRAGATIQVVKEHNGLMVTGTNDQIHELEVFVREVDHPTPQILIEALVVDFDATDVFELGVRLGFDPSGAAAAAEETAGALANGGYTFETGDGATSGFRHRGGGAEANRYLDGLGGLMSFFGIRNLGRLPADFFFQIHALSREGKANVRSRPQIATLNGHTASISIGTTQYYILQTNTPYQQPGQFYLQQTERFEKIEANVRLEITPWVSASGEVTAEIRPEFSTPVGELDPEVPPTINSRVLDSTVRLQDGETIILGGLIQEKEAVVYDKVPILGSVPLLGRLFRGQTKESRKAELVIFLTPHVFYGDERDAAKWQALQDRLDLSSRDETPFGYTRLKR